VTEHDEGEFHDNKREQKKTIVRTFREQ